MNEDGSTYYPNVAAVWAGTAGNATTSFAGLRFNNINIPRGAVITSARVEMYSVNQAQWITTGFQLAGEAVDNATTFAANNKPSQRPLTAARITHSSNTQWGVNTWYVLQDVLPVVQEIINRPGWRPGNSLALILRGTGGPWGRKYGWAYESSPANAARLVITYTVP